MCIPLSLNRKWLLKIVTAMLPRAANLRDSLDTLCCSLDAERAAAVTDLDPAARAYARAAISVVAAQDNDGR